MSAKLLQEAYKKFANAGFSKGIKDAARETAEQIAEATPKEVAATAGITTLGAGMVAHNTDLVDFTSDETKEKVAVIAGVGGALTAGLGSHRALKMAGRIVNKQPWKRTDTIKSVVENMDNTLMPNVLAPNKKASFYKGQPLMAVAEEAVSAGKRSLRQFVDPRVSIASKRTGSNLRQAELFDDFEKLLKEERYNMQNMQFKKGQRGYVAELKDITDRVKQGVKVLHHKYVNDFSNAGIFRDYFDVDTPLSDYVRRFLTPVKYDELVKQSSKVGAIGKEALDNMLKVQGFKTPIDKMQYIQLNTKGVKMGDMLRDIQWDPRSYRLFGKMQNVTEASRLDVIKEMEEVFGKGAVKKLKSANQKESGKLQIVMSPKFKSNFDWGGSAGTLIWDPRKPQKMQFFGTDGRDLFGMKLGKDIINVSPLKEISIPEIKKLVRKSQRDAPVKPVKRTKLTKKQYEEMDTKEMEKELTKSRMISKEDYEYLQNISKDFKENMNDVFTTKELAEFTGTRLATIGGGIGGFYGSYALAEDILE